jgi:integral membrane protein (TIGR01906 family)
VHSPLSERFAAALVAIATPFAVVAVAVLLFLNPIWVGFDQDRSDVTGLTGYTPAQVRAVTGSILSDLVFGPPSFAASLEPNGPPVLEERARAHMADVRTVLLELGFVALVAAIVLLVAGFLSRGAAWFWRGVSVGGRVLVVGVIVVGLGFAVFFEQAFELFHEIFFPPGTYLFDINTSKLVQLFPDQFWSETSIGIAAAVLGLGLVVVFAADRLGRRAAGIAGGGAAPAPAVAGTESGKSGGEA